MRIRTAPPALLLATMLAGGCDRASLLERTLAAIRVSSDAEPIAAAAALPPPRRDARMLRVSFGPNGPASHAVLLHEQGQRRLWRTEGGFALATAGARVVATSGQPQVLMATRIEGADPLDQPAALLEGEASARRLVDLATADRRPEGMRFGLEVNCRLRATAGTDRGGPTVLSVRESCRGPEPIGGFVNLFTIRLGDGAALRSEQWIGPGLAMLILEPAEALSTGSAPR
jgi:hypothetical protein